MIYEQALKYFEPFPNKTLCGFRKTHSTQHASFELVTSWQPFLSRGGFVGSIIMDLSKAYDCLKCIRSFLSYLTNHTQRIKIGSTFSDWTNIAKRYSARLYTEPGTFLYFYQ